MKLEILSEKPKGTPKQTPILFVHDMMLKKNWRAVADRIIAWLGKKGLGHRVASSK